jgi:hypothetical protein
MTTAIFGALVVLLQSPPMAERITDNVYRVGAVTIDTAQRTVTCPGVVNMDRGIVEYVAVAPKGKLHESVLRLDVKPLHVQVALLMLELEPKNVLQFQGERKTPQGDKIALTIRWRDAKGETQELPAESVLMTQPKERPLERGAWVFTGSRVLPQGFEADISRSIVAVFPDPAAIVDNPRPNASLRTFWVNPRRCPKRGTKVEFIITAIETEGSR